MHKTSIVLFSLLLLYACKYDKNDTDELAHAVRYNKIESVKKLLAANANPNGLLYENTFLLYASQNNQIEIMQLLLDAGADPNKHCKSGTAIFAAVRASSNIPKGDVRRIELLAKYGADLNKSNNPLRRTPLNLAIYYGFDEEFTTLIHLGADVNVEGTISMAVHCREVEMLQQLLDAGANFNRDMYKRIIPKNLSYASEEEKRRILEILSNHLDKR